MDGHKDTLTDDALAREIESALSVEPSPQFVAMVRERVSREPLGASIVMTWRVWLGSGAVLAGALALIVSLAGGPRETSGPDSTAAPSPRVDANTGRSTPTEPLLQEPIVATPIQRPERRAVTRIEPREDGVRARETNEVVLPEVLIPENEKRGFELLVTELRDTKHAAAVAEATRGLTTPGPPWLEIAPVVIEPLRDVGIAEGERQ